MVTRYFDGVIPDAGVLDAPDQAIRDTEVRVTAAADEAISRLAIHEAIASIWQLVDELNGYITLQEPWALSKDPANRERLGTVLNTAVRGIGTLAVLLSPVIPEASAKLWTALNGAGAISDQPIRSAFEWAGGTTVSALQPLFPRIESSESDGSGA